MTELMKLYKGRPDEKRTDMEEKAYDFLENIGVEYERVDHEEVATIEACAEVDRLLGFEICKNMLLCNSQKTNFFLVLMPGGKRVKSSEISKKLLSSRLSFAPEEHMTRLLGVTPGSVTVLGLLNDEKKEVKLAIDSELLKEEFFGCHPMKNTSTIKFKTEDLLKKILPAMGREFIEIELEANQG